MFRFVLIVLGMHLSLLFGAQFEIITELKEEPMHMGLAQLSDTDKLDNRGEIGALIIINCGLENVFFNNMAFKISQHDKSGSYWVVLKKRASYFVISKQGFADQHYNFPSPVEGRAVYKMTIDEKNRQPDETMVVITSNQNRAEVFLNDEYIGIIENRIFTGLVPLGEQVIELRKSGFKPTQVTHTVTADNNRLEINLEHDLPSALSITTEPAGATVYINNILFGITPKVSFFKVGTYPLRIEKEGYATYNDEITITEQETQQAYTLVDNRATLTINSSELATIKMNGRKYAEVKQLKLPPSVVELEISHPKAETINQTITLNPLENITLDLYSDVDRGSIIVLTIPTSAKIELTSDIGEFYSGRGSKSFNDIPVGKYYLEVSQKGYKKQRESIWLKKDDTVERQLVLDIETVRKIRKDHDYFNRLEFGLNVLWGKADSNYDYDILKDTDVKLKGLTAYELATDINEKVVIGLDLKVDFVTAIDLKKSESYVDTFFKNNNYFLYLKPSMKYKISEYAISFDPEAIIEITGYSYFSVELPISRVYYDKKSNFPISHRSLDILMNVDYGYENMSRYISRESLWKQFKSGYNVSTGLKFDAVRDNSLGNPNWFRNINSVTKVEFAVLTDFFSLNLNPYVIFDASLITDRKHHDSSILAGITAASDINRYINIGIDMSSNHTTPGKGMKEIKHRIVKSWINLYTKKHFTFSFNHVYQRFEFNSDEKHEYYDYNLGVSYLFDF